MAVEISSDEPSPARIAGTFGGISAVHHAVEVLKTISGAKEPLGVNEIARRLGLHKSTVSRLLRTLELHQFVSREAAHGRITLGVGLIALVNPMLGSVELSRLAMPILQSLATLSGETVGLALWDGRQPVMSEQVIGTQAVVHSIWLGKAVPTHATAAGKIFVGYLPPDAVAPVFETPLHRFTARTITDPEVFRRHCAECRARGYALNDQENDLESCGVAAPVFDYRGEIVAVLSYAVPKLRFDEEAQVRLAGFITGGAKELSNMLGWRKPAEA